MNEIVIAVIIGIITGVISSKITDILKNRKYMHSDFSGVWRDEIFEKNSKRIVKRDIFELTHNKDTGKISGYFKRYAPEDDKREWHLSGGVHERDLVFAYWATSKVSESKGCAFVSVKEKDFLAGEYFKEKDNKHIPVKLNMKKCRGVKTIKEFESQFLGNVNVTEA